MIASIAKKIIKLSTQKTQIDIYGDANESAKSRTGIVRFLTSAVLASAVVMSLSNQASATDFDDFEILLEKHAVESKLEKHMAESKLMRSEIEKIKELRITNDSLFKVMEVKVVRGEIGSFEFDGLVPKSCMKLASEIEKQIIEGAYKNIDWGWGYEESHVSAMVDYCNNEKEKMRQFRQDIEGLVKNEPKTLLQAFD